MIPAWKLRRETARIGRQLRALPFILSLELKHKLFYRRWYDLVLSRQVQRTDGMVPFGREIAIYLIYSPKGIFPSHLHVLEELVRAGIAPLVVSNCGLSKKDREKLRAGSVRVLERPNVGYDFGGYRDGILELKDRLADFDRLWILNDSTWLFPKQESWFEQARALGTDLVAASSHFAFERPAIDDFRDIQWKRMNGNRHFHYGSYALSIGSNILRSPAFLRFWKQLDIRNDKKKTVRYGEVGFTRWVMRKGFSHGATCEIDALESDLAERSHEDINTIARNITLLDNLHLVRLKETVLQSDACSDQGRLDRIALILTLVAYQGVAYTLPDYLVSECGFQFLKKALLSVNPESSQIMWRVIAGFDGVIGREIAQEACELATHVDGNRHMPIARSKCGGSL